jgi:Ca2+/Na+ antiporter
MHLFFVVIPFFLFLFFFFKKKKEKEKEETIEFNGIKNKKQVSRTFLETSFQIQVVPKRPIFYYIPIILYSLTK